MTGHDLLSLLRTVVERAQRRALCELCGERLENEAIDTHECALDDRARTVVRRHYDLLTGGNKERTRAKGYATR